MQTAIYSNSILSKINVRIKPEKVNTRSFLPATVRFSDAVNLFQSAEIATDFVYQRIFRFAMEEERDRQLKI